MCDANATTELATRAKEASEKAVVKAANGDLSVAVTRSGVRVLNREKGTVYEQETDGVVPTACECKADRFVYDGPCKHQVAAVSYLLNNPAALLTAVRHLTDGPAAVTVTAPGMDYDDSMLTAVAVRGDCAGEVTVGSATLPEYWAEEHGLTVSPDSPVVSVRFDGGGRRYDFPVEVLTPASAPSPA